MTGSVVPKGVVLASTMYQAGAAPPIGGTHVRETVLPLVLATRSVGANGIGAWATVSRKVVAVLVVPSLTATVIAVSPVWLGIGTAPIVRVVPLPPRISALFGTSDVLDEVAETTSDPTGVSSSPIVKGTGASVPFSGTVCAGMGVMVGGSSTSVTASTKAPLVTDVPSETLSVMVVSPNAPATGVMVSVRVVVLPPSTRPLGATTAPFDDAADTTRADGGVSASSTVKAIGPST